MRKTLYDMLYLVTCGIQQVKPQQSCVDTIDWEKLYKASRAHFLNVLVGMTLKESGAKLPKEWEQALSKAVRKNVLFDVERAAVLEEFEKLGIWYMPLKGVILKDYYPKVGMRQMSDNDILFDAKFAGKVREIFRERGYTDTYYGVGNHDVYEKEPVYNFEMHRKLYGEGQEPDWVEYYSNVKDRLLKDEGNAYGYHFSDEDFYVYIISHEYKHYSGGGTGLRSLVDVHFYLQAKRNSLDFNYIEKQCEILGIAEFEKLGRELCKRVFEGEAKFYDEESLKKSLTAEEAEMLEYYLTSGVYGTKKRGMENRIKKFQKRTGKTGKFSFVLDRLFPDMSVYRVHYPFFYRHKWLLPVGWLFRLVRMILHPRRRACTLEELKYLFKMKDEK